MNPEYGFFVDHINGDTLDNRRENLRVCTRKENNQNCNKRGTLPKSKYKGVVWVKKVGKWKAQIKSDKKTIYLGYFKDELLAAKAYNSAAILYFGEFARQNKIGSN
jgi:hypothetical protein